MASCFDEPRLVFDSANCIKALSKNVKGALSLHRSDPRRCLQPECSSLRTLSTLKCTLASARPCDSALAHRLDGELVIETLAGAFDTDGVHRGVHAGDFAWRFHGGVAEGRISGTCNAGILRKPVFRTACEECSTLGV